MKLRGRSTWEKDKPPIVAILERGGRTILTVAKNMTKKAVDELMDLVGAGSDINTDNFPAYTHLGENGWDHRAVNHGLGEYARGDDHVNTVEGVFQDLALARHVQGRLQEEPASLRLHVPVQLQP